MDAHASPVKEADVYIANGGTVGPDRATQRFTVVNGKYYAGAFEATLAETFFEVDDGLRERRLDHNGSRQEVAVWYSTGWRSTA